MINGISVRSFFAEGRTSKLYRSPDGSVYKVVNTINKTGRRVNRILASFYSDNDLILPPLIHHENRALRLLKPYKIAPEIIEATPQYIRMSYVGKPVTPKTRFKNLEERIEYIIQSLDAVRIVHNDLRRDFRNYCCLNGVLYLVDFQIADIKDTIPGAMIRKNKERHYNNNREDLEWFKSQFI